MTELDYILATDARAFDCALDCLKHVVPENNPHISAEQFSFVKSTLVEMRETTRAAIPHLQTS